jgi:periplasmic protein TonB
MPGKQAHGRSRFTIHHGFAVSLALHAALVLPFVLYALAAPPEEPASLVVELQGVVADSQSEEKIVQETKGEAKRDQQDAAEQAQSPAATPPPPDDQPTDVKEDETEAPPPPPDPQASRPGAAARSGVAGANDISGVAERQNAQTIKERDEEIDRLNRYVKLLTKKVMVNLVYPDEGRRGRLQGAATVSFTILPSGEIRPESLKIVASSGQPKLDESALKTVRSSVPFDPPPQEMTVAIAVAFGRKR